MRDYIFTRGLTGTYEIFDDTSAPVGSGPMFALAGNDDELLVEKQSREQIVINGLPPLWTAAFSWNEAVTLYFLLDKPSLMRIFGTNIGFGEQFLLDATLNSPPLWNTQLNPEQSPRETWHGNEWEQ